MAARVLNHWGHEVTVFDKNQSKLDYLNDLNIAKINEIRSISKFSFIIECTGSVSILNELIKNSSSSTSILMLGLPYGKKIIDLENIVSLEKRLLAL